MQSTESVPPVVPPNAEDTVDVPQVPEQPVEPGTQDLFSGEMETQASAGDWGDSECPRGLPESPKPPTIFSEEGSEVAVPKESQYLKNAGVRFSRVEDSVWSSKDSKGQISLLFCGHCLYQPRHLLRL